MKSKISALIAASAIAVATFPAVPAMAQETASPVPSSLSSTDDGGSSDEAALSSVALLAALGGAAYWAVQEGLIPNPLAPAPPAPAPAPAPEPARGDCAPQAFNDALWEWNGSPRTRVEYCDGQFAWVSQDQTDWRVPFEFDGYNWKVLPADGTTKTGMTQGCYNGLVLRDKGASEEFISRIPICTPDEIGYSPW